MKYRHKPLEVEAIQVSPGNHAEVVEFCGWAGRLSAHGYSWVMTPNGDVGPHASQWVLRWGPTVFTVMDNEEFVERFELIPEKPEKVCRICGGTNLHRTEGKARVCVNCEAIEHADGSVTPPLAEKLAAWRQSGVPIHRPRHAE